MSCNFSRKLIDGFLTLLIPFFAAAPCWCVPFKCDLTEYRARPGLTATGQGDALNVTWTGADHAELRAVFALSNGVPTIRDLAVKIGTNWTVLGENLQPEYRI